MKIDRYVPCPCGSGKKFKFCCEQSTSADSIETLCLRAADFRIATCRVVSGWEDGGLAQITIARQTPDLRYLVGFYLVDTYCLGVKDTFVRRLNSLEDVTGAPFPSLEEFTYEDARSLILGAVEYARQWGFEPGQGWSLSGAIVEAERSFKPKFTFGKDGKPTYFAGPEDDVARVLRTLDPLIKANKAEFVAPDDALEEELDNVLDEELQQNFDEHDEVFERLCVEVEENLSEGLTRQARKAIKTLIRDYPDDWEPYFFQATSLALDGDFRAAITSFERAAEIEPSSLILFNLAAAHKRLFELREYLDCLDTAIEIDDDPEVILVAQQELNQFADGVKSSLGLTLEQFREGFEDFDEAFSCLGQGRLQEAMAGFQKVLAIQPNHVPSHGNMGLLYAAMGDRDAALRHLDRAIELDPAYTPAVTNRRAVLKLPPGGALDLTQRKDIHFYKDQAMSKDSKR